jgi:hypothetical protein
MAKVEGSHAGVTLQGIEIERQTEPGKSHEYRRSDRPFWMVGHDAILDVRMLRLLPDRSGRCRLVGVIQVGETGPYATTRTLWRRRTADPGAIAAPLGMSSSTTLMSEDRGQPARRFAFAAI